jgi:hypothetical protein
MEELVTRGGEAAVRRLIAARADVNVRDEVGKRLYMLYRN